MAINKSYFGKGLKAIDLLILSQIEEFERNYRICYLTDKQFMHITGAGKSAVRASLNRLEDDNIIALHTEVVTIDGKAKKRRYISLIKNYYYAILKGNTCCVENQYIKDNLKK